MIAAVANEIDEAIRAKVDALIDAHVRPETPDHLKKDIRRAWHREILTNLCRREGVEVRP